jgi:hypothetical protein
VLATTRPGPLMHRDAPQRRRLAGEGLFYPARLSAGGDYPIPADDVDHPEVLDDLVDELIETVLRCGGWVTLVSDGALSAHDRVVLTLRT